MGKIMHAGIEYGGASSDGTTVIPNPEGEATDDLNTVQIGEDIFNVVGSGGGGGSVVALPSLYSTKEKMVGLWTDNKPLYQKTIIISSVDPSGSGQSVGSALGFVPDAVPKIFGTVDRNLASYGIVGCITYDINSEETTNTMYTFVRYDKYNDTLYYKIKAADNTAENLRITLQYTKTTDTPVEDFNLQDFGIFAPVIYSLDEREIGVWTDGKPLYQKTFDKSNSSISYRTWLNDCLGTRESGIRICNFWGTCLVGAASVPNIPFNYYRASNNYLTATINNYGDDINIRNEISGVAVKAGIITIQYTKTTDVAGSGSYAELGIPAVHIDDTERVIGTWFGETLYQKTVDCGNLLNNNTKTVAHGISSIEKIVRIFGYSYSGTNYTPLPFTSTSAAYCINITANTTNILLTTAADRSTWPAFVTLCYTKTTD